LGLQNLQKTVNVFQARTAARSTSKFVVATVDRGLWTVDYSSLL
jgi:hypothetical protein